MPTEMEIVISIVLFGSIFVGAGVKRYNRKQGEGIPTGESPLKNKSKRIIMIACSVGLDITYGFLAPFFLVFDVFHSWLGWSTLIPFISSPSIILILQILGCILYIIGYIIYVTGRLKLGGYFADMWQPAKLGDTFIQTGMFSKIRHPLYTGSFIFQLGIIIIFQTWLGLLLFIPITIITLKQASEEEQWMIERFGDEYKEYMKRTGRFFPKI